jgi:hypothetical protein
MAKKTEYSGSQLANQLIAVSEFLGTLGIELGEMTLDEAFNLKRKLEKTVRKHFKK